MEMRCLVNNIPKFFQESKYLNILKKTLNKLGQLLFFITASVFLYGCNAKPIEDLTLNPSQIFEKLAGDFSVDYANLKLPYLNISFIENLKNLGTPSELKNQKLKFEDYKIRLENFDSSNLNVCKNVNFSIMKVESDLGIQRAELGLDFLQMKVDLDAIISLRELPMGKQWYGYYLNKWNSAQLDLDEIYRFGEQQLNNSVAQHDAIQKQLGFKVKTKHSLSTFRPAKH